MMTRYLSGSLMLSRKVALCTWWYVLHSTPLIRLVSVQALLFRCLIITGSSKYQWLEQGCCKCIILILLSQTAEIEAGREGEKGTGKGGEQGRTMSKGRKRRRREKAGEEEEEAQHLAPD